MIQINLLILFNQIRNKCYKNEDYLHQEFNLEFFGYGLKEGNTLEEFTYKLELKFLTRLMAYGHIAIGIQNIYK